MTSSHANVALFRVMSRLTSMTRLCFNRFDQVYVTRDTSDVRERVYGVPHNGPIYNGNGIVFNNRNGIVLQGGNCIIGNCIGGMSVNGNVIIGNGTITKMRFGAPPPPIVIKYKLGEPPVICEQGREVIINEPGNYSIDTANGKSINRGKLWVT